MARRKKTKRPSFAFIFLLILFSLIIGAGAGVVAALYKNMPRLEYFDYKPSLTTKIYDVNGELIADLYYIENRVRIPISQIPKHLQNAIVAIEDERFFEHHGIDFRALFRAVVVDIIEGAKVQGGSTITQQLAKNAFLTHDKTFTRKILEAILAIQLERKYTKTEILELYLNEIYFGHAAYGVEVAAQTYFGKHAWELSLEECALLAAVPKGAAFYSPFFNMQNALERRNLVLTKMEELGYITSEEARIAKAKPIEVLPSPKIKTRKASYFIDQVVSQLLERYGSTLTYRGGLKVYTTLDLRLQEIAEETLLSYLPEWEANEEGVMQPQGAILVMDPNTGYVRAMVGGRGTDKYNRAVQAVRQPGSLMKPFVYAAALEQGYTLASIVDDSPVQYRNSDGSVYAPSNFDNTFRGPITLRTALQESINVAAVKILDSVGVRNVWNLLQSLGFTTLSRTDDYNLALALGGLSRGVTLLEMCTAYSVFANQGIKVEPILIEKVVDKDGIVLEHNKPRRSVISELSAETLYLMNSALQGVIKSPRGTGRRANIPDVPQGGKTGTSDNNTNAWFVGFTPNLVVGVYLGNDAQNRPMQYGGRTITSGDAAQIWANFIREAVKITGVGEFPPPPSTIVSLKVCQETGLLPGPMYNGTVYEEVFRKGTEPDLICGYYRPLTAKVCQQSGQLATESCPSWAVVTKRYFDVLVQKPDGGYQPMVIPEGFPVDEYCSRHGTS
jgi:penicillin-binding protein 1A